MKKKWFWILSAIALFVGVGIYAYTPDTTPTVKTMVLSSSRVEQTVSCNGVVEAVDGVGVFVPIDCYIREVKVEQGQRVKKGDVLAVIDKEMTYAAADSIASKIALAGLSEELVAPDDGIVVEVSAEAGKPLSLGTPCVLLVRPSDVQIRIAIREKDLRSVREGMRVRITGDGLNGLTYSGTLTEISSAASVNETVTVVSGVVTPDEGQADASFRLGISAKASIVTSVTEMGVVIPYEAVLADEHGSYVYVYETGVARMRRLDNVAQVVRGFLLNDPAWENACIIVEPEKVSGDGAVVMGVSA